MKNLMLIMVAFMLFGSAAKAIDIYVGNLHYTVDETVLKELFEPYGEVSSVKIVTDNVTKRSKGFAFVTMANEDEGMQAIKELNGTMLKGRIIVVNQARPKGVDDNNTRRDGRSDGATRRRN